MAISSKEMMKLRAAFSDVQNKVLAACAEVIDETLETVATHALDSTPIYTGNLRRSLSGTEASYNVQFGDTVVYGEVHFGEPGNIGGWNKKEAYTYMWNPGNNTKNWYGAILYNAWDKYKNRAIYQIEYRIRAKFGKQADASEYLEYSGADPYGDY